MYVRTGVLVTNLGVHFKLGPRKQRRLGHDARQRQARSQGAEVRVNDCNGEPLVDRARRDAQGPRARSASRSTPLGPSDERRVTTASSSARARRCEATGRHGVRRSQLANAASSRGASTCRPDTAPSPTTRAATVFDRTLVRAGETVSMKHFMRRRDARAASRRCRPTSCRRASRSSTKAAARSIACRWQWSGGRSQRRFTYLEHPAGGEARRLRGRRSTTDRALTSTGGDVERDAAATQLAAAISASRSSACRWSRPRRQRAEGRARSRGERSPSTCR